jgi:ABC-type nitrate/sulfonate/bicarbonate transport system substrate-binding protein
MVAAEPRAGHSRRLSRNHKGINAMTTPANTSAITASTPDTLWYTRCPVPTPLGLASQLGWFNEEFGADGITIRTLQEASDALVRESHYDHHLQNSFRQGGNVPAIWARANGRDTRVIGLNWIDESQLILALPQSGIRTPADLRGRRIGLPVHNNSIDHARASALRGFVVALEIGGVSEREVEWIDFAVNVGRGGPVTATREGARRNGGGYNLLIEKLQAGEVDAIFVKGARGVEVAHDIGATIVTDIRNHPDPLVRANNGAPRPVTVDSHLLQTRPDIVARFLARIVAIGDWAAAHPAETVAYVARESGSTAHWVRKAYGEDLHLHQYTDLAEASIVGLETYTKFLAERGFIPQNFDVRAWIDPQPLAEIDRYLGRKTA